jgi:hypothetical protein
MKFAIPCPGPDRRSVLKFGSVALAGAAAHFGARGADRTSNDPAVIFVWLPGGPPHQETFDLKPDAPAEYRGAYNPINTNVPGIRIAEHLPALAKIADKYSIIRSVAHTFADHGGGHKKFLTGRDPLQPTGFINDYPMVASMAAKLFPKRTNGLPAYVAGVDGGRQGIDVFSFGSAYLGAGTYPFMVVGDPADKSFAVQNLSVAAGTAEKLPDRLQLLKTLDRTPVPDQHGTPAAMDALRDRALDLVTSPAARDAFDLTREPENLRSRYGMHRYGQRALLARRLVERGATWVTMVMENATPPGEGLQKDHTYNWDSHAVNCDIFKDTKYKLGYLDQAISTLIADLYERGLDRRVLLVVTGEFGRTPKIEYDKATGRPGRDHWPQAMSILTSGACRTGQVIGSTTSKAEHPKDRPLVPEDLWATVFEHLHLPWRDTNFMDGTGRPMPMLPAGDVIRELAQ